MIANLDWSLTVDCPSCLMEIDLAYFDEGGRFSIPIFNNKWNEVKGTKVICPFCERKFEIDGIEH